MKKQNAIVLLSTSEVEYHALATATCEAQWLRDFNVNHPSKVVLYCNNKHLTHGLSCPEESSCRSASLTASLLFILSVC